jgi:hypothetical protein
LGGKTQERFADVVLLLRRMFPLKNNHFDDNRQRLRVPVKEYFNQLFIFKMETVLNFIIRLNTRDNAIFIHEL